MHIEVLPRQQVSVLHQLAPAATDAGFYLGGGTAIGRSAIPLDRMLALYKQKYDVRDTTHVLASLSYFDDAVKEPMPEMLWSVTWDEITATLEGWVRRQ
jgi:hypothetical protein